MRRSLAFLAFLVMGCGETFSAQTGSGSGGGGSGAGGATAADGAGDAASAAPQRVQNLTPARFWVPQLEQVMDSNMLSSLADTAPVFSCAPVDLI